MHRRMIFFLAFLVALAPAWAQQNKPRTLKPGLNFFSKQQDVQIGREYGAEVEKQMPLVADASVNQFVERIGRKLASTPEAEDYPYTFKVIQEKSINAFALPGGPTFTHTGLLLAAGNESQVAGVLAHEISHVALRHGTSNVTKANLIQLPAMIAAQMAGGGWKGMLAQLGISLGANSLLMKYSRNAERDADLLGARIMARAGYNPIEMARFFEKLEQENGKSSALAQFFSDHPNPGNRVKSVQDEILLLSRRQYDAESGELPGVQKIVQGMPEIKPPKPQQAPKAAGSPGSISAARPSGRFQEFRGRDFTFQYPDNWEVLGQDRQSGEITIAARAGVVGQGIGYGLLVNVLETRRAPDLARDTGELIRQLQQRDPNLRVVRQPNAFNLRAAPALATRLEGPSPFDASESLILVTLSRPRALFYMLFIAPESDLKQAQASFDRMADSIQFPN